MLAKGVLGSHWLLLLDSCARWASKPTLQNKDFVLLDIRSWNLGNIGGPMEILRDLNVLVLFIMYKM